LKEINEQIADYILQSQNIDISQYNDSFFEKSVQKRIEETRCNSINDYYSLLKQNTHERHLFIDLLNNNYSEFFRNPLTFAVLERIILPAFNLKKKNGKEIRIWSAATAGGQEAYSLAMLLREFWNGDYESIKYRIFATDINKTRLNEAQEGKYSISSLNNISLKRLEKWFTKKGSFYTVKPELKENIYFSVFDLHNKHVSSPPAGIFGDFDIVVCANLLFYYKVEIRNRILDKINHTLGNGGYLITGETEREILLSNDYIEVYPQSAIFQRRMERG